MRKYTLISVLLALIAGSFACASDQDGPQQTNDTPVLRTLASPAPAATPVPMGVSGQTAISGTAIPATVSGTIAASNTPLPAPTPTATPYPSVTPTATPVPKPSPTPTAIPASASPEGDASSEDFLANFTGISYEAAFDMPGEFTEGGYPVTATVSGWVTTRPDDNTSQFFTKIDMNKPVKRSIEVVSLPNTFNMYLHDLDTGQWYFLPENSAEVDVGPIEDISQLWFFAMLFSASPRDEMQQVPDGYIYELAGPAVSSATITYDQAYTLETYTLTDPEGKQLLRVRYFDLNKFQGLVPYEPVEELLPDTYWTSQ